ncbi:MAG: 4Fe-4S dicluster domain-containing protein [Lachnospiraceae bacterium]|nr:4Fe-4S dicluster domain-containing protein [Lachnospiraceae bacterium]
MKCGKCTASCPAFEKMEYHPHQFVEMVQNNHITPLLESESQYYCMSCLVCEERCPRGVKPQKLIEAVQVLKLRASEGNRLKPQDVANRLDSSLPQQALMAAFRKYSR